MEGGRGGGREGVREFGRDGVKERQPLPRSPDPSQARAIRVSHSQATPHPLAGGRPAPVGQARVPIARSWCVCVWWGGQPTTTEAQREWQHLLAGAVLGRAGAANAQLYVQIRAALCANTHSFACECTHSFTCKKAQLHTQTCGAERRRRAASSRRRRPLTRRGCH